MKLKILEVQNKGNAEKEYVRLEVTENCDLGKHALADTTYTTDEKVSNKLRHFYWFPDKDVKKGEEVVLRTCKGTNDTYTSNSGKKVHRYYWGLKSAIWNNDGDAAVLFEMKSWSIKRAAG